MAFPLCLLGAYFHRKRSRGALADPECDEKVVTDMRQATILWAVACVASAVWLVIQLFAFAR